MALVKPGVGRADGRLLASLLGLVLCVWAFAIMADLVAAGRTQSFDERLLLALRVPGQPSEPRGPAWLPGAVRDLTALGSAPVLLLGLVAVAGALAARRQWHALALLVAASASGLLVNEALKHLFARPRPAVELHLTDVRSLSFPSGHAMLSAIIYLTLATVLARLVQSERLKLYFVGLAFLLSFVVGATRVYLGVHYPSDVMAGWTAGLAWALVCWIAVSRLQSRGLVEPPQ